MMYLWCLYWIALVMFGATGEKAETFGPLFCLVAGILAAVHLAWKCISYGLLYW